MEILTSTSGGVDRKLASPFRRGASRGGKSSSDRIRHKPVAPQRESAGIHESERLASRASDDWYGRTAGVSRDAAVASANRAKGERLLAPCLAGRGLGCPLRERRVQVTMQGLARVLHVGDVATSPLSVAFPTQSVGEVRRWAGPAGLNNVPVRVGDSIVGVVENLNGDLEPAVGNWLPSAPEDSQPSVVELASAERGRWRASVGRWSGGPG